MNVLRARLTFANVVSCLALFVALGGSSYAAVKIQKNSIGSAQIKNNSITSGDVKNASLLKKDFKPGQLPAGARGATGAPGATGPQGPTGSTGSPGSARAYAHVYHQALVTSDTKGVAGMVPGCDPTAAVTCDAVPANGSSSQSPREYCFDLDFAPNSVQITPDTGSSSFDRATKANEWWGQVPAPIISGGQDGCPPGYRSVGAQVDRNGSTTPVPGFWITFN